MNKSVFELNLQPEDPQSSLLWLGYTTLQYGVIRNTYAAQTVPDLEPLPAEYTYAAYFLLNRYTGSSVPGALVFSINQSSWW
jgi:hypothetical protein